MGIAYIMELWDLLCCCEVLGMQENEERAALLKARAEAKREYQRLKEQERMQHPHIPKAKKQGSSIWTYLITLVLLVLLGCGGAAFWGYRQLESINTMVVNAYDEPYELKEGATLNTVVRDLAQDRYHPYLLSLWVKLHRHEYSVIQKGPYLIDGIKTLPQILEDMEQGNIVKIKLPTIPLIEGMTITMVERRLSARNDVIQDPKLKAILLAPQDFIYKTLVKKADDKSLLQAIGGTHSSLEGLLMPATYEYEPGKSNTVELLSHALIKMANFMRESYIDRDQSIDDVLSDPYQVLIMASLVERESSLESERSIIAGVFINRLRKGMKLQTDPAVMYGVSPDFKGPLRLSQLRRDTPYNTYTRAGLPPTPIAMPSKECIEAVLNPAPTKAIYFVAKGPDPQEGHIFSNTLQEHNQAVKQYRKAVSYYKKALQEQQAASAQ